ncbi:SDR family NAD(P)-dependent oxidoreductase [Hazenella coriacea]|uniref:3-oxoacyl-[acyl-carrier protein] reductase n=1 Tax=Hazenella coriacea TaxID=1179467 RepID=A0A4R3L9A4_9BACL|nr:SDR family oxidoreductase [Hazenella coriacea]TCS95798.1 3-oxoacyl-[acyl-carrier protein] reductase [Hazenella coriacea]
MEPSQKRVFLVAGGSSGIGSELIQLLVDAGEFVYNLDLKPREGHSNQCKTKIVDLQDVQCCQEAITEIIKEGNLFKGVAVIAGVGFTTPLEQLDPIEFNKQVNLNLNIVYNLCYFSLPHLDSPSSIVTVSSTSVYGFSGSSVAYAAAKAGVIGLTKCLAHEVGRKGIRVNCVIPGAVDTDLLHSLSTSMERSLLSKFTPLGQLAHPRQIAQTIQFLLGDQSSHITGQTLVIDGGLSLAYRPGHM